MLDVELCLRVTAAPSGQTGLIVSGDVVLDDKLTSPKFSHIYKLRYHHVFFGKGFAMHLWSDLWPVVQVCFAYHFA
jgi:hypothetical protein